MGWHPKTRRWFTIWSALLYATVSVFLASLFLTVSATDGTDKILFIDSGNIELFWDQAQVRTGLRSAALQWAAMDSPSVTFSEWPRFSFHYPTCESTRSVGRHVIVPMWLPTLVCSVAAGVTRLLSRKRDLSLCVRCSYCLNGNASGRCPECGTTLHSS